MMAILRELGIIVLLTFGILLMPCAAKWPDYSEQQIVESLGKLRDWSNGDQRNDETDLYAEVLGRWMAWWPKMVKLKDESTVEHGSPESVDRPYHMSKQCSDAILRLSEGLSAQETWALKMVDASGKVPSGFLLGNSLWVGMYGECLSASSKQTDATRNSAVVGEYCLVSFGANASAIDLVIKVGICIPQSCNSTDAIALINGVLSHLTNEIHATDADCHDNNALPLDALAIVVITILCVLGVLLVLGTCFDVIKTHWRSKLTLNKYAGDVKNSYYGSFSLMTGSNESTDKLSFIVLQTDGFIHRFLMAFSILSNAKKIFSLEPTQNDRGLRAIHGIRVLSLNWVLLSHTYVFAFRPMEASNGTEYLNLIKRFTFQAIINASVSVDTFFLLSGTLLSYFLLKEIRDEGGLRKINWPKLVFHRFWRLTPMYMMSLAIYTALFKYFGSGPLWQQYSDEYCTNYWWTNLLFINNIVHNDKKCMLWTWYMANDVQFFLLSTTFLALLYKRALIGGIVVFVFMLASSITTGVITYVHHYPPSTPGIFQNTTWDMHWFYDVYFTPWCRINPYLVGILLGYILYRTDCKLRIHRGLVVLGWCLAAVCNLSVLYGLYEVSRGNPLSPSVSALYGSVNRTVWAIGIAWVILACATGHGGFVNDLLSLPVMQPLSRLTYAVYLIHPMVILWYYLSLKVPLFVEDITMVYMFLGHLVLSYICAFVFSIAFESPTISVERYFLRNRKNQG